MSQKLSDHIKGTDFETSCIRNNYTLMLVGTFDSPIGPRRKATLDDCAAFGEWRAVSSPPENKGDYLLEGTYANSDGEWESAVLPVWFHLPEKEFEVIDGDFESPRQWMEIPWLPEVWEAAKKMFHADTKRHEARMEQLEQECDAR